VTGYAHACALESNGTLWCWGANSSGQVGNGTTTNALSPVQILSGNNVVSAAAGEYHTCAIVKNGSLECWGDNTYGELGIGNTTNATSPIGIVSLQSGTVQVALSAYFSCAVRGDGALFCWGVNTSGQLGIGNFTGQNSPAQVTAVGSVQQVVVAAAATCARTTGGGVSCWGEDIVGEVGDGSGNTNGITSPFFLGGLPPSASIVGGGGNNCSIGTDASILCWGWNGFNTNSGELGNGTLVTAWTPTPLGL
jgi:alpha-tubulin suppressor-like RCC1 family protein